MYTTGLIVDIGGQSQEEKFFVCMLNMCRKPHMTVQLYIGENIEFSPKPALVQRILAEVAIAMILIILLMIMAKMLLRQTRNYDDVDDEPD